MIVGKNVQKNMTINTIIAPRKNIIIVKVVILLMEKVNV